VDALAHQAALDAAGATIAVLGSGIDDRHIGPPSNRPLAHRILRQGGLIVSEYSAGSAAHPGTFPARNRIIAGLSHGVLVVEADRHSGSLITARCALNQDREVFAVPGSIYWPGSAGANWLIARGAHPAINASDIREHYRMRQLSLPDVAVSTDDPVQAGILALLRTDGPQRADAIVAAIDAEPARVLSAIALLELNGSLIQDNETYRTR
jgi:DNA processing protein